MELMVRAAQAKRPFDLVLIDARMPSMHGEALGRAIRSHSELQSIPMVVLMERGRGKDWDTARKAGFNDFVNKPVKLSHLRDTLLSVLGHQLCEPSPVPEKNKGPQIPDEGDSRLQGRILLAEDNPINQKLAVHILEKLGHCVDAVTNGRLALNALDCRHYDLILMDVQMPDIDGLEATRTIREHEQHNPHPVEDAPSCAGGDPIRNPQIPTAARKIEQPDVCHAGGRIPIIAMTAHAMSGDREKCLEAGMDDYISKPVTPDILSAKIAQWLRRRDD